MACKLQEDRDSSYVAILSLATYMTWIIVGASSVFVELIKERRQHSIVFCKMGMQNGPHRVPERTTPKRMHRCAWNTVGARQISHKAPEVLRDPVRCFCWVF